MSKRILRIFAIFTVCFFWTVGAFAADVYMTTDISPKGLAAIYEASGWKPKAGSVMQFVFGKNSS